ncbi:hypothetical protein V8E52_008940 [Russula decolorans]
MALEVEDVAGKDDGGGPDMLASLYCDAAPPPLPYGLALLPLLSLPLLTYGFPSLALFPTFRQRQAEHDLLSLSALSPFPCLPPSTSLLASAASMSPSPVSPLAFRSVTFATASPTRGSLANFGRSSTILHGELYGILVPALLVTSSSSVVPPPIYTDHLNAVTVLNDALPKPPLTHSWSSLPARSLYRWIYSILTSSPNCPTLRHVRAHTSAPYPASLANDLVDCLASSAHSLPIPAPPGSPGRVFDAAYF